MAMKEVLLKLIEKFADQPVWLVVFALLYIVYRLIFPD